MGLAAGEILKKLVPKHIRDFKYRPQQFEMCELIEKSIKEEKHLIVEAATGVGKSIAYLIPSIISAVERKKKVIIATYTKVLQDQLIKKELPTLEKILKEVGISFSYHVLFGSENYLCLKRFYNYLQESLLTPEIEALMSWVKETNDGILLNLPFTVHPSTLQEICRDPEICLYRKCKRFSQCFYRIASKRSNISDIIVVNHHLFFTNLISGGKILPSYDIVIFDEAHNLEDVAYEFLGFELSNLQINWLLDRIYNFRSEKGLLKRLKHFSKNWRTAVENHLDLIKRRAEEFFINLLDKLPHEKENFRIRMPNLVDDTLTKPLMMLSEKLKEGLIYCKSEEEEVEIRAFADRSMKFSALIEAWLGQTIKEHIYWIEISKGRRYTKVTLKITPLEINQTLKEVLFDKVKTVVLTSATLSTHNKFNYIKNTLGIENPIEKIFGSPFDYNSRTIIYIPKNMPDPRLEENEFNESCTNGIKKLIEITKGNAFILSTSYRLIDFLYRSLSLESYHLLKQDSTSRYKLLEKFKSTDGSVLLATDAFWQGVDVPGEKLISVIIPKLPFDVPDHPMTEARMERIKSKGGEPFVEFLLPRAVLKLRQGLGRLMRRDDDWGIMSILDPRIFTRSYGKVFLNSIPKTKIVDEISMVKDFYEKMKNEDRGSLLDKR